MKKEKNYISQIPTIMWGGTSDKVIIAVHGAMSDKEDTVIRILADKAERQGYQVLSFDLRQYGERKSEKLDRVEKAIADLQKIMAYVKEQHRFKEIALFANSLGAYFSLLSYKEEAISKSFFLSPIVNMRVVIENMMQWSGVSKEELEQKRVIELPAMGQTLYQEYYEYVVTHPVEEWNCPTDILYGSEDNMIDREVIMDFTDRFQCNLEVLHGGEHWFHTKEQLAYYENWLTEKID